MARWREARKGHRESIERDRPSFPAGGKPLAPKGVLWEKAKEDWLNLVSDKDVIFDAEVEIEGSLIEPQVTWGTSPQDVVTIDGKVPNPGEEHMSIWGSSEHKCE